MSLTLNPSAISMIPGVIRSYVGVGGTAPYAYKIISGPGSINASTGYYTAPDDLAERPEDNIAKLEVTDDVGDTAQAFAYIRSPLELVCDILQSEMELDDGRVYIWDQKIMAPNDEGLFIAVSILQSKPFANTNEIVNESGTLYEVKSVNTRDLISVDVISRGPQARMRKEEVLMALKSVYADQQQASNRFYIGTLPTAFVNLSEIDGAAIPYRFNISLALQYTVIKRKIVGYYDTFPGPDLLIEA